LRSQSQKGIVYMMNQVQVEMLSAMSELKTEEDLLSLKRFLVAFYAQRIDAAMDRLWDEGKWNKKKLDELKTAHRRTAYV